MVEAEQGVTAFSKFRALEGDSNAGERDQLFRNMAELFAHVSERCDDNQVTQYDEILCQLADLVEIEARAHVANLLAPLERAPGSVVVKLAHDSIDVARPLLEFSNVLSDDDLIEIVKGTDEQHRVVIANRESVGARVGDAIVEQGGRESVVCLLSNESSELDTATVAKLVQRAENDSELASGLSDRQDVDWQTLRAEIGVAGCKVLEKLGLGEVNSKSFGTVSSVVYNRMRNSAGFSSREWKLAWNQVKALSDRRKLDDAALARFARFGYGHHAAAALTMLLKVSPEVVVKWLAAQDYVALTVACRAYGADGDLFQGLVAVLPWRDFPSAEEITDVRARFDSLSVEESEEIFDLWRSHSFRKKSVNPQPMSATG